MKEYTLLDRSGAYRIWNWGLCILLLHSFAQARTQCELQKIGHSAPQPGDNFGAAVGLDGPWAVSGAFWENTQGLRAGSAYVLEKHGGSWSEWGQIIGLDVESEDGFGVSADLSGQTIVVGAPWNGNGFGRTGKAYVFEYVGGTWIQTAKLLQGDPSIGVWFGHAVAIDADTIVVGAPYKSQARGAAYVYERQGGAWNQTAKLTALGAEPDDKFGDSVAISGDWIAVGAFYDDDRRGSVHLYHRNGGWPLIEEIDGPGGQVGDFFGVSVALSGDTLIAGAFGELEHGGFEGVAYVFRKEAPNWNQVARLSASDLQGQPYPFFGEKVAIEDSLALVYARGPVSTGAVYAFEAYTPQGGEEQWLPRGKILPSDHIERSNFGEALAIDGDLVMIGARQDDWQGDQAGSAYFFQISTAATPYCFGVGCPCGNDDPYAGCLNSTLSWNGAAQGALLSACGSVSSASDDLVLSLSQLPANQFGIFFMGQGEASLPFGDGLLCVSGAGQGIYRFTPPADSGSAGFLSLGPGIVARSQSFPPNGRIQAGATWNFQGWYRDPLGPCGTAFNLSNGLAVAFSP